MFACFERCSVVQVRGERPIHICTCQNSVHVHVCMCSFYTFLLIMYGSYLHEVTTSISTPAQWDAVHCRVPPSFTLAGTHLCTWVEREHNPNHSICDIKSGVSLLSTSNSEIIIHEQSQNVHFYLPWHSTKTTTYKRVLICYFMMSQTNNQEMLLKGDPPLSKPPL